MKINFIQDIKKEKIKIHNKEITSITIKPINKGTFTRDQVIYMAEKINNDIYVEKENDKNRDDNIGIKSAVSTKLNIGWRGGYFQDIDKPVRIYSYFDSKAELLREVEEYPKYDPQLDDNNIEEFKIYFYKYEKPKKNKKRKSQKGGCTSNNNNNCLYDCIKQITKNKCPFKNPLSLKKFLGLKYNSKIDIDLIQKIEEKMKDYKINIDGDYKYKSKNKDAKYEINIMLINGHYYIENKYYGLRFPKKEKKINL